MPSNAGRPPSQPPAAGSKASRPPSITRRISLRVLFSCNDPPPRDPALASTEVKRMQHPGISVHGNVRGVRHYDDPPPELVFPHLPHGQAVNQAVVEVVFWLAQY